MNNRTNYRIILMTFFGLLGSTIIGFIFFQSSIFLPRLTNFQFIAFGLSGALFYSFFEYKSTKDQLLVFILVIILNLIIFSGRFLSLKLFLRDLLFFISLFISIYLYHLFLKKNPKLKFYIRSLALVSIYGLMDAVFSIFIYMIIRSGNFPPPNYIYFIARYGILIGFGLGIGIDFYLQNENSILKILKLKSV